MTNHPSRGRQDQCAGAYAIEVVPMVFNEALKRFEEGYSPDFEFAHYRVCALYYTGGTTLPSGEDVGCHKYVGRRFKSIDDAISFAHQVAPDGVDVHPTSWEQSKTEFDSITAA